MLCLKRWLFDFSAPSFVMIWPTFSSTLNCSLALKSFMKRDKTWRIGRSSKKWSAMNFRASTWSNRNLVTCRKICYSIPSFWRKKKREQKNVGIYFKQMCRIEMLSQSRLKRRRKVSTKGQCRLSSRLSVSKKDWGACCLVLGWDWIITRGARQRKVNDLGGSPARSQPHFCSLLLFRTTACAAEFEDFWELQERQLQVDHWVWLEVTGAVSIHHKPLKKH